ncbi:hypothetical protein [Arthrobacter sp. CG_A4]|uniref:hypothetical protein n=1 Tax=Arthrobacter sp. CG_A4 TaxID=3071706 RepID=UPI002E01184F|nr:hypothetical protein [Arthrobacter sp. CG_A4]
MTDVLSRHLGPFLRRAGLLAGLLSIIAGIVGMHTMTGSHSVPTSAAVPAAEMLQAMQSSAPEHTALAGASAIVSSESAGTGSLPEPACADQAGCAMMAAMDATCIPSPGNASLAAPLPGNAPLAAHDDAGAPTQASTSSYLPGSPSPGDLCISRT